MTWGCLEMLHICTLQKRFLLGKPMKINKNHSKSTRRVFGTSFVYFVSNKAVKRVQISAMAKSGFQWINRLPWGKGSPMFPQLANGCNPSWDIMGIYPMSTWDFKDPWPPNEKQIQLYPAVAPRHNPWFQRRFMPFDQQTALAPIAVSPLFGQSYLPLSWKDKSSLEPMRNWSCWRKCVQ